MRRDFIEECIERNRFISFGRQNGIAVVTCDTAHCPDGKLRILINSSPIDWRGDAVRTILFAPRRHLDYEKTRIVQLLFSPLINQDADNTDKAERMSADELIQWATSKDYST